MRRWYRLSRFEQASQRSILVWVEITTSRCEIKLAAGDREIEVDGIWSQSRQGSEMCPNGVDIATNEGSRQRGLDADSLGIVEGLADQRRIDGQGSGFIETGATRYLRDAVEQTHKPAGG